MTLMISGIVLSSVLAVSSARMELDKIQITKTRMDRLQAALTVYYRTNGYLPCPAAGADALNTSTFAKEQASPSNHAGGNNSLALTSLVKCNNVLYSYTGSLGLGTPEVYIGVVPSRSLNLPDNYLFDGWGNRITYVVSSYCVARLNWQTAGDTLFFNKYKCSSDGLLSGTLALLNLTDGAKIAIRDNSTTWMTSDPYVVYVLISHGKNGVGSWNHIGTRLTGTAANSTAEKTNGNLSSTGAALASNSTSLATTYYDRSLNDGDTANYFDDIIRWKTAPRLDYEANH